MCDRVMYELHRLCHVVEYYQRYHEKTGSWYNIRPVKSYRPKMHQSADVAEASFDSDDADFAPLRCWDCNVNFTSRHFLYAHLFHHIKQPTVVLNRVQLPSLKITLKSKRDNSFEIVSSPKQMTNLAEEREVPEETEEQEKENKLFDENGEPLTDHEINDGDVADTSNTMGEAEQENDEDSLQFPSDEVALSGHESPSQSEADSTRNLVDKEKENSNSESNTSDYGSIPGAEPTPPPEPSPEYPKIRIKTTGLLKEPLTITEITDDNPEGEPNYNESGENNSLWTTPSLEDPLKLPDNDDNILSLFNNNNERAKDLGFHTSESEFISLDRLEERNRGAMQLYNPSTSQNQSPLDSLTGLPMQALAQQVSRLQPSGNGMHQQNVLINIQQFPSGPPQPSYQPPPMYPHYPPQPIHQPYQYQPPNPMYYPPTPPGYPPQHMPPPPQPQMPQMQQQQQQQQQQPQPPMRPQQGQMGQLPPSGQMPPSSQPQQMSAPRAPQQGGGYRQPPMQAPAPRQQGPNMRMPSGSRAPMGQRQPGMARQRAPIVRPRGGGMTAVRAIRPRVPNPPNGMRPQGSPIKRSPEQLQQLQAKKKKFDILTPDKDDDDCQVICMQPKNTDGGLPQIESVQGGTSEPVENSIMHLSDSITLSVRNPPPKPVEPKKSDAKAVANILATRGITVTATAKPKEKSESPSSKQALATPPASLNLNGAVSIIPSSKGPNGTAKNTGDPLPTVDLTDDANSHHNAQNTQQKKLGLPYRCDLCPAQYPNALGLNKHRQTFHKTNSGMCELGLPVINLKTPGITQKLVSMGIHNYIPVASMDGFALPVFNVRNPASVASLGTTAMITLGPVRSLPRGQSAMNNAVRPMK